MFMLHISLELPLTVTGEIHAKADLQLIIDYTLTGLLQVVVVPKVYRMIVGSELYVVQGMLAA